MFFMVVPKALKVKKTENAYLCINEGGIFFVRSDCISDVWEAMLLERSNKKTCIAILV